jgi:hypothetical protein
MKMTLKICTILATAAIFTALPLAAAVSQNRPPMPMHKSPKEMAPYDFTGYWVSIVDENWRFRMVTPPKGDFEGIFITPKAREIAMKWNPEADEKNGLACKGYGAPAIMQIPTRMHISWANDDTLTFEFDAGKQVRTAYFGKTPDKPDDPGWQGITKAEWEMRGLDNGFAPPTPKPIALKTVTTKARPGYIRKNGVPYSADAVVTEYYDILPGFDGTEYLVVKTIVDDPEYLTQEYVLSANFKRMPAKQGWDPRPCTVK